MAQRELGTVTYRSKAQTKGRLERVLLRDSTIEMILTR